MEINAIFRPNPNLKLMEQVQEVLRFYHYAYRTEQTYCKWIVSYMKFYQYKYHPKDMGAKEIERYLSYLASDRNVAESTQKQALNAIVFLYKKVLDIDIGELTHIRSKKKSRVPVVMTKEEVRLILKCLSDKHLFMAKLLYGCGLRILECHRLRIKDIDFGQGYVYVIDGKGGNDRNIPIPRGLYDQLAATIESVRKTHESDLSQGFGDVYLPNALAKKYKKASKEFSWQYLFPAHKISKDPRSNIMRRHHLLESGLQKAIKRAVLKSGIAKRITAHTFRHSYATHLLEDGVNIRILQKLMGHKDVKTTEIYTHVIQKDIRKVPSPLDSL
ncbi:MAG: integron integrase [Desulfotalea sp.]